MQILLKIHTQTRNGNEIRTSTKPQFQKHLAAFGYKILHFIRSQIIVATILL